MAKTGPQKIPGASQTYFYGTGQYSGSDMEVNCGVVHTTEGRTVPSYSGGAMAPTVTGMPDIAARKIRWYQHFDVDESARALANKLGGVQTNTANAFQVELVGTCDDKYAKTWGTARAGVDYLHWPTAPDWALAEVAWLVRWLNDYHQVPLTCVKDWLAYGVDSRRPGITPASYGSSPARMTFAQWTAFTGWCGHQHVPENDHGDPGSMNFARVIQLAKGDTTPLPEEDMTPEQAQQLAKAASQINTVYSERRLYSWGYENLNVDPRDTYGVLTDIDKRVKALESVSLTDAQVAAIADKVAASPTLAEKIAELVADKLAARLAE